MTTELILSPLRSNLTPSLKWGHWLIAGANDMNPSRVTRPWLWCAENTCLSHCKRLTSKGLCFRHYWEGFPNTPGRRQLPWTWANSAFWRRFASSHPFRPQLEGFITPRSPHRKHPRGQSLLRATAPDSTQRLQQLIDIGLIVVNGWRNANTMWVHCDVDRCAPQTFRRFPGVLFRERDDR